MLAVNFMKNDSTRIYSKIFVSLGCCRYVPILLRVHGSFFFVKLTVEFWNYWVRNNPIN